MIFKTFLQDIYAVNDIAFHPIHGTLATVGSDGRFSFWDKVSQTFYWNRKEVGFQNSLVQIKVTK